MASLFNARNGGVNSYNAGFKFLPCRQKMGPLSNISSERILVLDFGSQYAQLIARRVREQHVYCEIVRHDITSEQIRAHNPTGLILSGGPNSVYETEARQNATPQFSTWDCRCLGICYGMQLMCDHLGGKVDSTTVREYGRATCTHDSADDLIYEGLPEVGRSLDESWRSSSIRQRRLCCFGSDVDLPCRSRKTQNTASLRIAISSRSHALARGLDVAQKLPVRSLQMQRQLEAGEFCQRDDRQDMRTQVGDAQVICGLSGGVDSSVVAALLSKAIGSQLSCILVDNGLLRKGEREMVVEQFTDHFKTDLRVVDGRTRFLDQLKGIDDPQEKRRRIGHTFIECFKTESETIENAKFLAQGTLYPDVIESGAAKDGPAATIKLHHNVGGLPEELGFELIEPLRDLFKDEVRALGVELGLPEHLVWRHPFPGPGLAVRCLGEVVEEKLVVLRDADAIVIDEIEKAGLYRKTSQLFAVLLPVQSVGVMGDARTYENALVIRCVNTDDFMTADWSRLPYDLLATMSTRIINEVSGVNRVCYDISSKPPATIEWE